MLSILLVSLLEAILFLSGASDVSELSEEDLTHFRQLNEKPLRINSSTIRSLSASRLFTAYQQASILDYIERNGPILSGTELAGVDGFTSYTAEFFSLFLDYSFGEPSHSKDFGGNAMASLAVKNDGECWKAQHVTKVDASLAFGFNEIGASIAYKSPWISSGYAWSRPGMSVSYSNDRANLMLVAGYYNARVGQGLMQWNGIMINSYTSPSTLMKRSSGISSYKSYSVDNAMLGAGARMDFGRSSVSAWVDVKGTAGASVSFFQRHGVLSVNGIMGREDGRWGRISMAGLSLDAQYSVRGMVLYGELLGMLPFEKSKALLGMRLPAGNLDIGIRGSAGRDAFDFTAATEYQSPSRRHKISGGVQYLWKSSSRLKARIDYNLSLSDAISLQTRLSASMTQSVKRYELRQDFCYERGSYGFRARLHGLYARDFAVLGYVEGSFLNNYLQAGVFKVDNWDDRIYVYQRDAPGSFNVPAMYGRGTWLALYSAWTLGYHWRIYLRMGYSFYSRAENTGIRRYSQTDARVQMVFKF